MNQIQEFLLDFFAVFFISTLWEECVTGDFDKRSRFIIKILCVAISIAVVKTLEFFAIKLAGWLLQ